MAPPRRVLRDSDEWPAPARERAVGADATLFNAARDVRARAARPALEKGVACRPVTVDVFAAGGPPTEHLRWRPLGRTSAFGHDGFRLLRAGATTRHLGETFRDAPLRRGPPWGRMDRAIGGLDA